MRDSKGKHRECKLALGAFIADLQEQWEALGLRYFRDVSTLATKEDVCNPDSDPPLRHEVDMNEVKCSYKVTARRWHAVHSQHWAHT